MSESDSSVSDDIHDEVMSDDEQEQVEDAEVNIALGQSWKVLSEMNDEEDGAIPLHPVVLDIITNTFKFSHMSPVQENAIPLLLKRTNVLVQACTGSGKTLAYLTPTVHHLLRFRELYPLYWNEKNIYAIIICPTRELAKQVYSVAQTFTTHEECPISVQLITGGSDLESESLLGHIAICTPGRLLDILSSSLVFPHDHLQSLILDEADRLLDMGFSQQLIDIIKRLKQKRRSVYQDKAVSLVHGLFSATMSDVLMNDLVKVVALDKKDNAIVSVQVDVTQDSKQATPVALTNYYLSCEQDERLASLCRLLQIQCENLKSGENAKVIVYFLTCTCVDYYSKLLQQLMLKGGKIPNSSSDYHFIFYSLHGKLVTKRRQLTYEAFVNTPAKKPQGSKSLQVMLCTDIAARGLDLPNVELIIQYDAPTDPTSFVHRVGRTARMGKKGESIIFLSNHESDYVEYLTVKKIPITKYELQPANNMDQETYNKEVFSQLKSIALQDREILERGYESFLSFVRAYRDHQCEYIFRIRQLNFASLARAYVLTQIPTKMREIKKILPREVLVAAKGKVNTEEDKKKKKWRPKTAKEKQQDRKKLESVKYIWDKDLCKVKIESVPYKDERKEKAKKVREEKEKAEPKLHKKGDSDEEDTSSKSLSQKKRVVRESKELNSRKKKRMYEELEWDDFAKEQSAYKRLKSGKISEKEYAELTNEADLEAQVIADLKLSGKLNNQFVSSLTATSDQKKKRRNKKKRHR